LLIIACSVISSILLKMPLSLNYNKLFDRSTRFDGFPVKDAIGLVAAAAAVNTLNLSLLRPLAHPD